MRVTVNVNEYDALIANGARQILGYGEDQGTVINGIVWEMLYPEETRVYTGESDYFAKSQRVSAYENRYHNAIGLDLAQAVVARIRAKSYRQRLLEGKV